MTDHDTFDADGLTRILQTGFSLTPDNTIYIAFSGGPDSTALLHALANGPFTRLVAAHAHHGHEQADAWRQHCQEQCAAWGVSFTHEVLQVQYDSAIGWEASARKARYRWLASLLQDNEVMLTAHHQQDQAETVLAHLLRGAGVTGLSGMPAQRPLGRGLLLRPLLSFSPDALRQYLVDRELVWVDDPSNQDTRYTRNLIRHQFLPELRRYWPAVIKTLAGTAGRLSEIDGLLSEIGAGDLASVACAADTLSVSRLRKLSAARQTNTVRCWLRSLHVTPPDHKRLQQVLQQLVSGDPAPSARVTWGNMSLRRYRDGLYLVPLSPGPASQSYAWDLTKALVIDPPGIKLQTVPTVGSGLVKARMQGPITVRWRQGGERCRLPGRAHRHALKKMLQDLGVPPWQRGKIPLLYCGDELAAVIGHCYCAPFAAQNDESAVELTVSRL